MKKIHEKGPKYVICMMGTAGSMCYDGKDFHRFGIIPCEEVVDSMGAGDSYIAGFLKGMIEGKNIEEAMKLGATNATETLKYFAPGDFQRKTEQNIIRNCEGTEQLR